MTAQDTTSNRLKSPPQTINNALNSRWKYFKSLQGHLLAACFDSAVLDNNPRFIEIDRIEYDHLIKEMQS